MAEDAPTGTVPDSNGRHRASRSIGQTGGEEVTGRPARSARRATGTPGRFERPEPKAGLLPMLGLGVGLLLLVVPVGATVLSSYVWGADPEPQVGVPVAVASPPPATEAAVPDPTPSGPAQATPDGSSTPTPRATAASATPAPTPTRRPGRTPPPAPGGGGAPQGPSTTPSPPVAAPPPPPAPVSLGPDGREELTRMMDEYCDRHVSASWADPRSDGQWECQRLLLGSRRIDLDTACRDTYGDGAFADNANPEDAFGWRCFRR